MAILSECRGFLSVVVLSFACFSMPGALDAEADTEDVPVESYFDFWLGSWDLTWRDQDGNIANGINHIERVLDGEVIRERFSANSGAMEGFKGESYSVYDARAEIWKQTWVDNNGGYLDFVGHIDGDRRIFQRETISPDGEPVLQRMVFYDITDDSFTWDWQISNDEGESWELRWRIWYERVKSNE